MLQITTGVECCRVLQSAAVLVQLAAHSSARWRCSRCAERAAELELEQTTLVLLQLAMAQVSPHKSGGMYSGIAVMGGTRPNGRILQAHNLYIGVVWVTY